MARYPARPHPYPQLFNRLKDFVHDNHFDTDSLSILNEVDGGFYDFTQSGYTYSFTIKLSLDPPVIQSKTIGNLKDVWASDTIRCKEFYITIECRQDTLRMTDVFGLTIMETRPHMRTMCNSVIFKDDLVRKQIEFYLNTCLLPF